MIPCAPYKRLRYASIIEHEPKSGNNTVPRRGLFSKEKLVRFELNSESFPVGRELLITNVLFFFEISTLRDCKVSCCS